MKNKEILKHLKLQLELKKEIRKAKKSIDKIDILLDNYISEVNNVRENK